MAFCVFETDKIRVFTDLHSDTERRSLPDAAAILCLLGKLSLAVNDTKKAVDAYVSAVKVNPFLWEAFTGLCNTGKPSYSYRSVRSLANSTGVSLRVNNIFKQSAEMLEYCKTMPTQSNAPLPNTEDPPARIRNATENYQNDPFTSSSSSSSAQTRDRSDLSYSNHPSFFNRLNEGSGSSSTLDTPTAQTSVSGSHDLLGGGHGLSDKPPPVRKTRATATDVASRKLTSRTTREANPEIRRPSTEASAPPAPARRSTRLNTLKFGSKSGGIERETRLASKDRDRESKKRAVSARMRTNLSGGGVSLGKEKEKDRGSNDINVRGNPTSCHPARNIMAPASQAADDDSVSQNKRKAPTEPSLTRVAKKQMSDVASRAAQASAALAKPQADKNREEAQSYLLDIYRKFGNGYYSLNRYYCPEALAALNSLPANQRETPRIQCLMGKAYYEMAQYKEVWDIAQGIEFC